jgi:hypothetical protein
VAPLQARNEQRLKEAIFIDSFHILLDKVISGVPINLDNDIKVGFGPENVQFLPRLPCGDYLVYARVVSEDKVFEFGTATVRVFQGEMVVCNVQMCSY